METNLLQTKLYIPPTAPSLVPRARLIDKLNAGLWQPDGFAHKLTLVSAPAGFGKTTLITAWLKHNQKEEGRRKKEETASSTVLPSSFIPHPFQVVWLSLDEDDNDLHRFFSYLAEGMRQFIPNPLTLSQHLQSPQPLPAKTLAKALINDVVAIASPFLLVLDDFHTIQSAAIGEAVTFLLDHMPPQMHLVITSRVDPPLPLSRLRARRQITEIRAADLRMSAEETAVFLNDLMQLNLSPSDIATLEARTEGWVAGLQLASLALHGHKDVTHFIQSFSGSHHFVLDYLVEEVLHQQPEHIQTFLLRTSILDRLCGSLCDAVLLTDAASGQATLEQLQRANMFIIPLDDERRWYRYHHLFADLLRQRLQQTGGNVAELNGRASMWYEENGLQAQAIHYALAAKDFARTATLIELAWPEMDRSFETATWLDWAKQLPDDLIRTRPVLSLCYAWALLNGGELEAAETRLRDTEQLLETSSAKMVVVDEAHFQSLPASIATAHCYIAQAFGDIPNSMKYAQQALALYPEDDYLRRGPAASLLGLMYWSRGELEAAHQALADGMAGFQKAGQIPFALSGTYGLADIRIAQGRLQEAVQTYERALQLAKAQGEPATRGTADIYLGLAGLHHEWGDPTAANQYWLQSEALGEQAALADWPYRRCLVQARMKAAEGALDDGIDLLDEAQHHYFRSPVPLIQPIAALKTQLWLAQGKLSAALNWVQDRELSVDDDLSYLREFEHLTLVRVLLAEFKNGRTSAIQEAIDLLNRLLNAAEAGQRMGSILQILLLQAIAHAAQGNIPLARAPLTRALTLAEPEGYVRLFVNEGSPMAQLLSDAATRGVVPTYTGKLLAAFETEKPQHTTQSTPSPKSLIAQPTVNPPMVDPLSKRELEILTLIAAGLKNKEIATELVISLNTVLYHNKNIYSKLGVNKRTLAITKAKEHNLI